MPEGKITALRVQEHDRQRVNVFIDEVFALGVSLDTLSREQLYVGKYIDAEQWATLEAAETTAKAFQAGLRLLQTRPRSTAEIRERLQRKQFSSDAINQAVQRLTDLDLLDDAAFARLWVENRNNTNPRGQQVLRQELYSKGIDRSTIDSTLNDEQLVGDEHEQALELARAALPRYASLTDKATFQRRLGGYLQRRGFTYETIKPLLADLWREVADSADEETDIR